MEYPDRFIINDVSDSDIYVHVCYYSPARPIPNCQNPNKDAFYDDGDPEEIEFEAWVYLEIKGIDYRIYLADDINCIIRDQVIKDFIESQNID